MEEEKLKNSEEEIRKGKKRRKILIIIIMILLLIILLMGCFICNYFDFFKHHKDPSKDLEIDPNQGDYQEQDENNEGDVNLDEMIAIPGIGTINVSQNETVVNGVDFYNPEHNIDKCYLSFELRLPNDSKDGYEVLYTSKLVEPSKHIQKITLNRTLPVGKYQAELLVQPYSLSDKALLHSLSIPATIVVQ